MFLSRKILKCTNYIILLFIVHPPFLIKINCKGNLAIRSRGHVLGQRKKQLEACPCVLSTALRIKLATLNYMCVMYVSVDPYNLPARFMFVRYNLPRQNKSITQFTFCHF